MVDIGPLTLENGAVIDDVSIAVQRWGELSPNRDNVVVVLHALTGDSHITGPAGPGHPTRGGGTAWRARRPDRHRPLVCGRHQRAGRLSRVDRPQLARFRRKALGLKVSLVSVRDQVEADVAALAALGITEVAAVVGGSMGGARALEWIVSHPETVRSALVLAVGARATADQIGTQSTQQVAAIKSDPNWQGRLLRHRPLARSAWRSPAGSRHLTAGRGRTGRPVRNDPQGDEDPGDRWPLRRAELPGTPGVLLARLTRAPTCR